MTLIYKEQEVDIDLVIDYLKREKLVAFPTETVYALSCLPNSTLAIENIYKLKGRDPKKPLAILSPDIEFIEKIAVIDNKARMLIERFTPGPITFVLKRKQTDLIANNLNKENDTIAVRIPKYDFAINLMKKLGTGIVATSCNISGESSAINAEKILEDFNGKIDLVIDGGSSEIAIPSTVVDLTGEEPKILRQGSVVLSER